METTPRHPTVTSGPILGTALLQEKQQNHEHVHGPENLFFHINNEQKTIIKENASKSLKRIYINPPTMGLEALFPFIETKTVWHPKGR